MICGPGDHIEWEASVIDTSGLMFGIYPLSVAGTPTGLAKGPQDDYGKIQSALLDLGGGIKTLPSRNYVIYMGPETEKKCCLLPAFISIHSQSIQSVLERCLEARKNVNVTKPIYFSYTFRDNWEG
jgi:hypothetical protein